MPALQRNRTRGGLRYDIHFQVVRGRRIPYVYVGSMAYSLEEWTLEMIERDHNRVYR